MKRALTLSLLGGVLATVVVVKHLALLGCAALDSLIDKPRALVVLDISTNLTDEGRVTEVVEVVVLDLEVLTQGDEDVLGLLEGFGGSESKVDKGQSNRQVEAVVGGLVDDDEHVLLHGEVVEVDVVLGGGDQITQLTELSLEGGLMEELNEVNVGGVRAEALLQDHVDSRLQHEGVVDGNQTNILLAVPAGLATAGDGAVHDIVADQEEGLKQLGHPAEDAEMLELLIAQGLLEESQTGVGDREATVQLATGNVDIEGL